MTAELLRGGVWLPLQWATDAPAQVTNEIEGERVFEFRAPYCSLRIYAEGLGYEPGGASEIRRGDTIRILSNGVEVMRGLVDVGVEWDAKSGHISLNVIGFLAGLKQVKLGRSIYTDPLYPDPFSPVYGSYRYRKVMREKLDNSIDDADDLEFEYIALPAVYDVTWADRPGHRLGYEKVWLFDTLPSRAGFPFLSEFGQKHYRTTDADGNALPVGVYRRVLVEGQPLQVAVADVVTEIVRQLNETNPNTVASTVSISAWNRQIVAKLVEEQFRQIQYFRADAGGANEQQFAIGYGLDFGGIKLARIENNVNWIEVADLPALIDETDLTNRVSASLSNTSEVVTPSGAFRRVSGELVGKVITRMNWKVVDSSHILIYRGHSWLVKGEYNIPNQEDNRLPTYYQVYAYYRALIVDFTTGLISWNFDVEDSHSDQGYEDPPNLLYSVTNNGTAWVTSETDPLLVQQQEVGGNLYFNSDGVPMFSGIVPIDRVGFAFKDASAADVLLELAVLTNSILSVGVDPSGVKRIYLTSRGYTGTNYILGGTGYEIQSVRMRVRSYYGSRTPAISSSIVSNDDYNNALARYYEDTYYPSEEEEWDIELMNTAETSAIKLLDGVKFPDIGIGAEVVAATVYAMQINDDRIVITARRAR